VRLHSIEIAGLRRDLPVVPVSATTSIAFLKLYGDFGLMAAATARLAELTDPGVEVILGPEAGGILLAHEVAEKSGLPYVIARKRVRPNMADPLAVPVTTIGTSQAQILVLGRDDAAILAGRQVALIDEVVSSGNTVKALTELVRLAQGKVTQVLAVASEGQPRPDVTALVHLPLFETTSELG
jgi:adenine phosphoribosyltransferase